MIQRGSLGWCPVCGSLLDLPSTLAATQTDAVPSQQRDDRLVSDQQLESATTVAFTPGEIVAGRYRIVSLVGRGGMGSVYRADDLRVGQPVALKFLSPRLSRDQARLEHFIREVRLARQISHPNICRVYDLGDTHGRYYLSMEYIDGEDLASLLRRVGRLPAAKALDVAHQLCAGLAAAHDRGVLHLDLKPANVMIDGRGRALITDFGIATSAEAATGADSAGTPAYMAPEQLTSQELTVRTDLYTLGLVLYETFTGRRVFGVMSAAERLRSGPTAAPTPLSDLVGDIDPVAERAILSCLEWDSSRRPRSAIEVSASLPGGNAVVAALAAGRVPSPEIIAATRRDSLRPAIAGLLTVSLLTGVAVLSLLNRDVLRALAPRLSPPVLVARAQEIVRSLGYSPAAVDSAYWFTWKETYAEQAADRDATVRLFEGDLPRTSRVVRFVYRESPVLLVPTNIFGMVLYSDPPAVVPGMVDVNLDPEGRLLRLCVVPGTREPPSSPEPAPDWSALLERAGLHAEALSPVAPVRTPPMAYDVWAEWEMRTRGSDMPTRITAAAFDGKPVYFDIGVVEPRHRVSNGDQASPTHSRLTSDPTILIVLGIATLLGAALLARYHVRRGQADRRGAWRLGVYVFSLGLITIPLRPHHLGQIGDEYFLLSRLLAMGLYASAWGALLYLAFEPHVRRRWPDMLIGWNRILAGRFSDPIVGRDVLIGSVAGTATVVIMWFAYAAASPNMAIAPPFRPALEALREPRHFASVVLFAHYHTLAIALAMLVLFLLLHVVLRARWLAVGVWILAIVSPGLASYGHHWTIGLPAALATGTIAAFLLYRVGLLALCAMLFANDALTRLPAALEFSAWYAGRSVVTLAILLGIVLYAARIAVGGEAATRDV
jgi:hypothetical protein